MFPDTTPSYSSAKPVGEDSTLLSSRDTSNRTDSMARESTLSHDSTGNQSSNVDRHSLEYVSANLTPNDSKLFKTRKQRIIFFEGGGGIYESTCLSVCLAVL